ncbi:MAG: carbohydrate-binding family 9-like protein [Bacteroidetes bacterium]|nr:carbohydrate-binding family 9-like protein [Bacteroidota bacterium]
MNFLNLLLIIMPLFFSDNMINIPQNKTTLMQAKEEAPVYNVSKLRKGIKIDADWNKAHWKKIKPIDIKLYMGKVSSFQPEVQAKMMYDPSYLYVIFRVKDRFVKSVVTDYNGPVSTDSCVEFFFSPDSEFPLKYFNLEVNAGGTPLMCYIAKPKSEAIKLVSDELKQIEIAHSLPAKVDPEITEPVTWTIEYRLPISILIKYSNVTKPAAGVVWKANFYKTGSKTSNPNYLTWSFVDNLRPNFHLPQFFGTLNFK